MKKKYLDILLINLKYKYPVLRGNTPLKIGIHKDIPELDGLSKKRITSLMRKITGKKTYLRNLSKGVKRIDLDGNPVARVSKKEMAIAKRMYLSILEQKRATRRRKQKAKKEAKTGRPILSLRKQ